MNDSPATLDANRLRWMIAPDGWQLMPEDRWMGETLSSMVLVFSYRRAKFNNIPLT